MYTHWLLSAALMVPVALAAQKQPAPPSKVTATADLSGSVTISWNGPGAKVAYRVLRSTDPKSPGADLARPALEMGTVSFSDAGVAPGTTYYYQVIAVYADGTEDASVPVQFVPPTAVVPGRRAMPGGLIVQPAVVAPVVAPAGPAPVGLHVVSAGPLARTLSWFASSGASGYNVSLAPHPATGPWQLLNPAVLTTTSYLDNGLRQAGVAYRVTALYPDGRQGSADLVYNSAPPLQVPTAFAASKRTTSGVLFGRTARLTWGEVTWAKGYRLFGTGQPSGGTPLNAALAPQQIIGLSAARTMEAFLPNLPDGVYTWQLTADYGGAWQGAGLPTASITIFDLCAPPQPTVGAAPQAVNLTGSGGAGSPVTVTVSWPRVPGAVAYTVERENYTAYGPVTTIGSSCAGEVLFPGMIVQPFQPPPPHISFLDDSGGLVAGSGYRYRVTAFGPAGEKGSTTGLFLVK